MVALAAAGIVATVVFAVVAIAQGLIRPGYSFVAHPVVALVDGPTGWVQDVNFVVVWGPCWPESRPRCQRTSSSRF